jgi:hypothetical protein
MNKLIHWILNPPTDGPAATFLLRLMAGGVFFWEGILKFVYANQGVGRFTKLGFPAPHFTATADGWFEIIGGHPVALGFPDAPDCCALHYRDAGGDGIDEDSAVSGDLAAPVAARATTGGILGRVARDPIGVRATYDLCFSVVGRTGTVVHRCRYREKTQGVATLVASLCYGGLWAD